MTERTQLGGSALFVGQATKDTIIRIKGQVATGDQKKHYEEIAEQPGGNAFTSGVTCSKLTFRCDIISGIGDDDAGRMIEGCVRAAGIYWHPRQMTATPHSVVIANESGRVIYTTPKEKIEYVQDFPRLDIQGCRLVHFDGHQMDAALHYAREARRLGVLTSIDVGKRRNGIEDLLDLIDFAVVSARFCEDMSLTPSQMLAELRKNKRRKMAAVTLGAEGLRYFADRGPECTMPAFKVPEGEIVDENGAGDVFNGARICSSLKWPEKSWTDHFKFATAAVALKLRRFGNAPPTLEEVQEFLHPRDLRLVSSA